MNTLEKLQEQLNNKILGDFCIASTKLKDGSIMSIQASKFHYSTPKNDVGPYTHVEVWGCGEVPAWADYGDGEDPYAYVPIELVVAEIDRRGGFVQTNVLKLLGIPLFLCLRAITLL